MQQRSRILHVSTKAQCSQINSFLKNPHCCFGSCLGQIQHFNTGSNPHWPHTHFGTDAAAKSLQSCPTLCNPLDGSPPGSPVPGILQARTVEWVAISFSNAWKWKVKVKSLSRVRLVATPWTAAHQAPPSVGFSRQEYWMNCYSLHFVDLHFVASLCLLCIRGSIMWSKQILPLSSVSTG